MKNFELKCAIEEPIRAVARLSALGARLEKKVRQTDIYLKASRGRLKIRADDGLARAIIGYNRRDEPLIRESEFDYIDISSPSCQRLAAVLLAYLPELCRVSKGRSVYKKNGILINLDEIDGWGSFIEIEAPEDSGHSREDVVGLFEDLDLKWSRISPWSYENLIMMRRSAQGLRGDIFEMTQPPESRRVGRILLIDGASGVGKTTVVGELLKNNSLNLRYARRHTTRKPRPDGSDANEYIFVEMAEFRAMADQGEFLEYRDFDFGMSYGLAWATLKEIILEGTNAIGVMNLGGGWYVKQLWPDSQLVLVKANHDVVKKRLDLRGFMTEQQIEERLQNNETVSRVQDAYDIVVDTSGAPISMTVAEIRTFIEDRWEAP